MTCPLCAYGEPHRCENPIPPDSVVTHDGEVYLVTPRPEPSTRKPPEYICGVCGEVGCDRYGRCDD